jgi:hypothetical protein
MNLNFSPAAIAVLVFRLKGLAQIKEMIHEARQSHLRPLGQCHRFFPLWWYQFMPPTAYTPEPVYRVRPLFFWAVLLGRAAGYARRSRGNKVWSDMSNEPTTRVPSVTVCPPRSSAETVKLCTRCVSPLACDPWE